MGLYDRDYMRGSDNENGLSNFTYGIIGLVVVAGVLLLTRGLNSRFSQSYSNTRNQIEAFDQIAEHDAMLSKSPININTASVEDLMLLPRVDAEMALAIIDQRPFKSIEQLDDVYGIGPATIKRLRPHISIEDTAASEK
ncbi:MAG: helix-hairpin-helix domain-containing protein [Pirellulaceae bacterium]